MNFSPFLIYFVKIDPFKAFYVCFQDWLEYLCIENSYMEKGNTQLRTYARISGSAGILVYLVYLFAVIFPALLEIDKPNTTADTSILGFLILGFIFAWFREYEGGIMLMFITAIAGMSYFYQDAAISIPLLLGICIPLFLSGMLFALYHYYKTRQLKNKS